jgi:WS/DGAT/MGAT family acyltransferase
MTSDKHEPTDAERWTAAAAWSRRPALDPLESMTWRSERHPARTGTSCIVILLDREPDWDRFRDAHEWGTSLVRRLRQRVLDPAVPTTSPIWVDDVHFSLAYHLRRRPIGGSGSCDDLLDVARQFALRPFDRSRPLWESMLVTGLEGGGAAYVLKIHQVLTDSAGTVQLLTLLQSATRRHTPNKPVPTPDEDVAATDAVTLARVGLRDNLAAAPTRAAQALGAGLSASLRPQTVLAEGLRYAASVRRILAAPPAPNSPLLEERDGRSWRFLALSCSLAELRAAGHVGGGSLHDAFVAALAGGLQRYHAAHGVGLDEIPIRIRVSLERAEDPMGGLRSAGAMIAAPTGIADPADRIAAVRGEVLSLHTERALDAVRAFAPLVARLPSAIGAAVLDVGVTADASASTVQGPTQATYMAGAKVQGIYPFSSLPGVALAATLLAHGDRACIGVNLDERAVRDPEVLRTSLQDGLDEVAALGR